MGLFNSFFKSSNNNEKNTKNTKSKIKCEYDLDSVNGIRSIPIPKYKPLKGMQSPEDNIEYILQRKATEHKKNGNIDLAIECLKKSNEIMPHSNFSYSAKDYLRLIEFLKQARRFDEAEKEEKKLRKSLPLVFDETVLNLHRLQKTFNFSKDFNTDLVIMSEHPCTCELCAKYQGRVFSISGKDKRFPKIPDIILKTGTLHNGCHHSFHPFIYGVSYFEHGDPIKYSNRPFVDTRTPEEKKKYEINHNKEQKEKIQLQIDKNEYDFLYKNYPNIAPKSFNAYRRMKNTNSSGYVKIKHLLNGIK